MNFISNLKFDVIFLQDTHLTEQKTPFFNTLWQGKAYHSCYKNNSRGSSILISKNIVHEVLTEHTSEGGNYIFLECKIGTKNYLLGRIYGPNRDEPQFYCEVDGILENAYYDDCIIGGDFNFVIDIHKDSYGYSHDNNIRAKKQFKSVCEKHNLLDIWRAKNDNAHQYTWYNANASKGARLDMLFVSDHLSNQCSELTTTSAYRTDHNMLSMKLEIGLPQRGPGLWKFNETTILLNPRRAGGCLNTPFRFFADSWKTAARSAAVFGTAVYTSFPHTL